MRLTPFRLPILSTVLPLLLAACGGGDTRLVVCTAVYIPAVSVQPVDEAGRPLEGVQISWRLNGGSPQTQTCLLLPCAVDSRGGQYELVASKAGYLSVSVSLLIASDECHAQTQQWKPVLPRK